MNITWPAGSKPSNAKCTFKVINFLAANPNYQKNSKVYISFSFATFLTSTFPSSVAPEIEYWSFYHCFSQSDWSFVVIKPFYLPFYSNSYIGSYHFIFMNKLVIKVWNIFNLIVNGIDPLFIWRISNGPLQHVHRGRCHFNPNMRNLCCLQISGSK